MLRIAALLFSLFVPKQSIHHLITIINVKYKYDIIINEYTPFLLVVRLNGIDVIWDSRLHLQYVNNVRLFGYIHFRAFSIHGIAHHIGIFWFGMRSPLHSLTQNGELAQSVSHSSLAV
mmetsp:Transcript_4961/g.6930  ORF Transcript_4961/g.6930 Transcript_4961/m.6930 type:complete len:118 (+) Transcript_4961:371-724(+)